MVPALGLAVHSRRQLKATCACLGVRIDLADIEASLEELPLVHAAACCCWPHSHLTGVVHMYAQQQSLTQCPAFPTAVTKSEATFALLDDHHLFEPAHKHDQVAEAHQASLPTITATCIPGMAVHSRS